MFNDYAIIISIGNSIRQIAGEKACARRESRINVSVQSSPLDQTEIPSLEVSTSFWWTLQECAYLRHVLSRIATHPINRIEELLPWNVALNLSPADQAAA
jgi:transposase